MFRSFTAITRCGFLFFYFAFPSATNAQVTDVCGDVSGSWAAGVYRSTCSLRVPEGQSLSLANGAILKLDAGHEVVIEGTLSTGWSGGGQAHITSLKDDTVGGDTNGDGGATAPAPGDWGGIFLDGSGSFTGTGYFYNTTVRYGGGAGGSAGANVFFSGSTSGAFNGSTSEHSAGDGVRILASSPSFNTSTITMSAGRGVEMVNSQSAFTSCEFSHNGSEGVEAVDSDIQFSGSGTNCGFSNNGSHGLHLQPGGGVSAVAFQGCSFTNNAGWAVRLEGQIEVDGQLQSNSGSGNTYNGIALPKTTVVTGSNWYTTGGLDFPFVLFGDLTVAEGVSLALREFNVLKLADGVEVVVQGSLNTGWSGPSEAYITSLKDDTVGGDTNGDGGATVPTPGDWSGIFLDGSGSFDGAGHFYHTTIRYGGGAGGSAGANVFFSGSTTGTFNNCTSEYSAGDGLRIADSSPGFNTSTITMSAGHGLEMVNSQSSFATCAFSDNVGKGVEATNSDIDFYGCDFTNNGGHGLHLQPGAAVRAAEFSYCSFTDNGGWAALLEGQVEVGHMQGNGGSGNTLNGLAFEETTVVGGGGSSNWYGTADLGFPFVFLGDLTVAEGITMAMRENHAFKFADGVEVVVHGTLSAGWSGGGQTYITSLKDDTVGGDTNGDGGTTTPAPGDWAGIFLDGSGNFYNTTIRYGGGVTGSAGANVFFSGSTSGSMSSSTSEFSAGDGVRVENAAAMGFSGNVLSNNSGFAIRMENMDLPSLAGFTGTGNGYTNGIGVAGTVAVNQTWPPVGSDFLYVLLGTVFVPQGVTLNLGESAVLKCAPGAEITVHGELHAMGEPGSPIKITSIADDSVVGDTNGDGAATTPAPGDWEGVNIIGASGLGGVGRLEHVWLTYGGNPAGNPMANLTFRLAAESWFFGGRSAASATEGMRIEHSSPRVRRSWFVNNDGYGLFIEGASEPDLGQPDILNRGANYFAGNDADQIQIYNASANAIDAHHNVWEYASTPEVDAHIWDDDEDPSLGEVRFGPWWPNQLFEGNFDSGGFGGWSSVGP